MYVNASHVDIKRLMLVYWEKRGVSSHTPWKYVRESQQKTTTKMISNINYYYYYHRYYNLNLNYISSKAKR